MDILLEEDAGLSSSNAPPQSSSTSAQPVASKAGKKQKKISPIRIFEKIAALDSKKKKGRNILLEKEDLPEDSFVPGSYSSYEVNDQSDKQPLNPDINPVTFGDKPIKKKFSWLSADKNAVSEKASLVTASAPLSVSLQQSENFKIAQSRIKNLEAEVFKLREENESLVDTGNSFKEHLDKLIDRHESLKVAHKEMRREFSEEKNILDRKIREQIKEIKNKKTKDKEFKEKISKNIQHIGSRERELENRLELVSLENQTLSHEKDRCILDLKNQIDELKSQLEKQRDVHYENSQKIQQFRDQCRKATQAMKIALSIFKQERFEDEDDPSDVQ